MQKRDNEELCGYDFGMGAEFNRKLMKVTYYGSYLRILHSEKKYGQQNFA